MKSETIIMALVFGFIQIQGQTLEFKNSRKILENGKPLLKNEVIKHMESTPEALQLYTKGKNRRTAGAVTFWGGLGIAAGGVLINNLTSVGDKEKQMNSYPWMGYFPGTYTEKNYTLSYVSMVIGGGLIITSIPLKISGRNKIKKSVDVHNNNNNNNNNNKEKEAQIEASKYQISFVTDNKGAGVRISF